MPIYLQALRGLALGLIVQTTLTLVGHERAYTLTFYAALVAFALSAFMPGWPLKWAGRGAAVGISVEPSQSDP